MTEPINKLIARSIHILGPEKIILFGSYANGNQNIYSDVDLLVISRQIYRREDLKKEIS